MRSNGSFKTKRRLDGRGSAVDSYDVREWFARDPSACISDKAAQKVLREYDHPSKYWITFPVQEEEDRIKYRFEKAVRVAVEQQAARGRGATRASINKKVRESAEKGIRKEVLGFANRVGEALVADQFTPWSQSLRNHLSIVLPEGVVTRFADYLSGYLLVLENETARSSVRWEDRSKKSNDGRKLKKLIRKLNGGPGNVESMLPASATNPQKESLKTKLICVMSEELVALGYSRKIIADKFLPFAWDAVGGRISVRSFLRTDRRSRQRTTLRK